MYIKSPSFQAALSEVEYHKALCHPNIVECIDSDLVGVPDLIGNKTSQVLILLPYYQVSGSLVDDCVSLNVFVIVQKLNVADVQT